MGAAATGQIDHAFHQVVRAFRAFGIDHGFEGVEPLLRFNHIGIVGGLRQDLVDLG